LERICRDGVIFRAHSDLPWTLDGANVHVSIVCFAKEPTDQIVLDGIAVGTTNADLSALANIIATKRLSTNKLICFRGSQKRGAFDLDLVTARKMISESNPHGIGNIKVIRPSANGADLSRRWEFGWIIDFGSRMSQRDAARFEQPFGHIEEHVKPARLSNNDPTLRQYCWIHGRSQPDMRQALEPFDRFIATPRVARFRSFCWLERAVLPDDAVVVFARSDDYFFGVLHSAVHELWARRMGTQLREAESGFRYTPTSCFETFPLPWPPGKEPSPSPDMPRPSQIGRASCRERV